MLQWVLRSSLPQYSPWNNNVHILLNDIKTCSLQRDIYWGQRIHARAIENYHESNMYVATALVKMYGNCGTMVNARHVFDAMQKPDVVSWTSLLLGYADTGQGQTTLELFLKMKASGCSPDSVAYIAAVKACTSLAVNGEKIGSLKMGRQIHGEIGCHMDRFLQNMLVYMYSKCGSIYEARTVFESINYPDVVSWNALLLGYAEAGQGFVVLELLPRMKGSGCVPNSVTYVAVIKAFAQVAVLGDGKERQECLEQGREIHSEIPERHLDDYVRGTLIDMYGKCGSMCDARLVFDGIENPNVVAWNALLHGYAENGQGNDALGMFSMMKSIGCVPDSITYVAALKACTALANVGDETAKAACLERGRQIHAETHSHLDLHVKCTLIDMYSKCGSMRDACSVFESIKKPNVVVWNALLLGYADAGEGQTSLDMFRKMKACGCVPDPVTYVAALKACTCIAVNGDDVDKRACMEFGRQIHMEVDCHLNHHVQATLINMYAKCGSMLDAQHVFDSIRKPNVVSWTALVLGYAENGEGYAALDMFSKMKASGCTPDTVAYVAALKACGLVGALLLGRKLYCKIERFTTHEVSCVVDFFAKCGSMVDAREVFDLYPRFRDVRTWTALLAGYGNLGDSASVFRLFEAMLDEGMKPDAITFVSLLLCCSHAGLVEKARKYFTEIPFQYQLTPTIMHYNCMVDVLGRVNQLNEVIMVIREMPCNPDTVTWLTLLGACRKWKNVEIGILAFQSLVNMDAGYGSAYVLMGHIYDSKGMWEEQRKVLQSRSQVWGKINC